jgi:hypothetical protein
VLAAVSAFLLVGYTLVYAAIANGGALARNPWLALTHDAYAQAAGSGGRVVGTTSTWDSILGWGTKIAGWAQLFTNPASLFGGFLP